MIPKLTIAICTLGFDSLYKTLESIEQHKGNHHIEILVIGRADYNRLKGFSNVRYTSVKFSKGDLVHKRNLAFSLAKSEVIAFIDDDTKITADWITNGLKHFKDKKVGIVSGPGIVPQDSSFNMRLFGNTLASLGAIPIRARYRITGKIEEDKCGDKIIGCNMFIRKNLYGKIKGFNPKIIPAEEIDFAHRTIKAGFKVIKDPNVYLYHYARSGVYKFVKQIFRFGMSKSNTLFNGIQPFKPVYALPPLAILLAPILLFLSCFILSFKYFTMLCVGLYFIAVLVCSMYSIIEDKYLSNIFLGITIPLMHLSYGLGELYYFFDISYDSQYQCNPSLLYPGQNSILPVLFPALQQ